MESPLRRWSRSGQLPRIRRTVVAMLLTAATCLASVTSATPAAEAQTPTPPRPLILIGGTFTPHDFRGNQFGPPMSAIVDWFEVNGGYREGQNLTVWELNRLSETTPPPRWSSRHGALAGVQWTCQVPTPPPNCIGFVDELKKLNLSTAGLAPVQESVNEIKRKLTDISRFGIQVDVIGHSQAGFAARAAVRQMKTDGISSNDNVVRKLVMLGSPPYGVPVETEAAAAGVSFNAFGIWNGVLTGFTVQLLEDVYAHCRDNEWLPVCPDLFRNHSNYRGDAILDNDWRVPNPANPNASSGPLPPGFAPSPYYAPWSALYRTPQFPARAPFFPALNDPAGIGPTPGAVGQTEYFNVHSVNYPGVLPADDARIAEPPLWIPPNSPHVQDWYPQHPSACGPDYAVAHTAQWTNPAMQSFIGWALGFIPVGQMRCT